MDVLNLNLLTLATCSFHVFSHIQYDPLGRISGLSLYINSKRFLHYMSDYEASCEASDDAAYEANIRRFTLSLPARKWF